MAHRRFKSHREKRNVPPSPAPSSASGGWRDRVTLVALPALLVGVIAAVGILVFKARWNTGIDTRLSAWQTAYQLSDDTVARFRRIELAFHGSGNPFTSPIQRSEEEVRIHHEEMAALMKKEQGEKFLRDLRSGRWNH